MKIDNKLVQRILEFCEKNCDADPVTLPCVSIEMQLGAIRDVGVGHIAMLQHEGLILGTTKEHHLAAGSVELGPLTGAGHKRLEELRRPLFLRLLLFKVDTFGGRLLLYITTVVLGMCGGAIWTYVAPCSTVPTQQQQSDDQPGNDRHKNEEGYRVPEQQD